MPVLYRDRHVTLDDEALTIHGYYLPAGRAGDKRVPYAAIRKVEVRPMGFFTGRFRVWGMQILPLWFHFDASRPRKDRCLVLDLGKRINPAITPENLDEVERVLREQLARRY